MRVVAIQPGFFGGRFKEIGDQFDIDSAKQLGKWMVPVGSYDGAVPVDTPRRGRPPRTMSEINKTLPGGPIDGDNLLE